MPPRPVAPVARDPVESESIAAERALVAAVRAGDRQAFETVFRAHAAGLTTFVERYVRSPEAAEELVQDLLLAVWRDRVRWDPPGSIGGYLYRAARNRAFNWLKRAHIVSAWQMRVGWEASGDSALPADAATLARDVAAAIRRAVAALPERRRLIFQMSREHGLSYADIAAVLGLSPKTVDVQMGRALRALRAALAAYLSLALIVIGR